MDKDPQVQDIFWLPLVFIALLLFSTYSDASSFQAKDDAGNVIVINDKNCPVSFLKGWKAGDMSYQKKNYKVCWKISGHLVVILDSEGDITPVPMDMFRPATEG